MTWKLITAFDVFGDPKGQPRHRAIAINGKVHIYNPKSAMGWKEKITIAAAANLRRIGLEGPIKLSVQLRFARPKRLEKKAIGLIPYISKPDADNAAKLIMDSLTEIGAWHDDCQVMTLEIEKYYAPFGYPPGALIKVYMVA